MMEQTIEPNAAYVPDDPRQAHVVISVALIFTGAFLAAILSPAVLWGLAGFVPHHVLEPIIGIVYAIGVIIGVAGMAGLVIPKIQVRISGLFGLEEQGRGMAGEVSSPSQSQVAENYWPPVLVGYCESVLYPTSLLMGYGAFIGLWLTLKTSVQWKRWQEETQGRHHFQKFLVGNALSIGFGISAFWLIQYLGMMF